MGLEETVNLERLATAFEKIAVALQERNRIELDRLGKLFPPEKEKRAAEVIHPEQDKREQYSDRATPEWFDQTEAALPPSKFKTRFDAANKQTEAGTAKRRRVVEVPTKH
jgi:hypothetical protein